MHNNTLIITPACRLPTQYGEFQMTGFVDSNGQEHAALSVGNVADGEPVLLRLHSECLTGDAFHSLRCDCGSQLAAAMQMVQAIGRGVIIYLRQEGRGIGLANKIRAYHNQDKGMDTVEANVALGLPIDARQYSVAAEILRYFNIQKVRLMTNNPQKIKELQGLGVEITERIPLHTGLCDSNQRYMQTKFEKMGHLAD